MNPKKDIPPEALEFADRAFELVEDPKLLFSSEGERNAALFAVLKAKQKAWENKGPCMYRGCTKQSISKSHTIQRSGPIDHLIEAGHVLTPRFEHGELGLKLVGASTASTFPGFCSKHELMFQVFESKGVITSDSEINLQIFRTICRELRRKRYDLDDLQETYDEIRERLEKKVREEAVQRNVEFKKLDIEGGLYGLVETLLADGQATLTVLERLYDNHLPAVDGTGDSQLARNVFQANIAFPVALSGLGVFGFNGREINSVLGVIPQAGGSLIYMVGAPGDQDAIDVYLQHANFDLVLIDIVESWMIRASDHWFLRPSIWASIPEMRQKAILDEIMDTSKGMADPLHHSVFDDLRRIALAVPQNPNQADEVLAYVAAQRAKLL